MEFNPIFREDGGGLEYTTKTGVKYVIFNDPQGMLMRVRSEGKNGKQNGTLPVSLSGLFTSFDAAKKAVEKYIFEQGKGGKITKKK